MKNAINNKVGMLGDMFLWLLANLKQGGIYFLKQALPPNISAGSVTRYMSTICETAAIFTLKMEFVSKITIFSQKMMLKSGLGRVFLNFLHAESIFFQFVLLHRKEEFFAKSKIQ